MLKRLAVLLLLVCGSAAAWADAAKDCADKSGDAAIVACNEAIRLNPKNADAFNNRGVEYRAKGDYDRALADYNEAIRLNPKHAAAFNSRGIAYRAKGDNDRAIADYNEAIRLNPKYVVAFNNRGDAYKAKGELDRAIAEYNEAIRLNPKYATAFDNRGDAYKAKGELDRAIADYSKALEIEPKNVTYVKDRGYARFDKGDFKEAAADLLRAIEITDNAYPILFRFLARARAGEAAGPELEANAARLKTKEWPFAAIELLAGKRTPEATLPAAGKPEEVCEAHFYIGEWHLLRGDKTAAATALKVAVDTCPKSLIAYHSAQAELKRLGN